ncbi:hypothetical protein BDP27DRAFT_1427456 [Rhodocollybia butyracea]|uniref:DUF7918 domain-containing protein n=1 Tax=Rhodocollybia butyracea TaxID=206335 RepID=A0A9P5PC45_9AGAR|nr:hypothetical protein BDP27DRAFT_1427456 [Rhodocollybia butyracea]
MVAGRAGAPLASGARKRISTFLQISVTDKREHMTRKMLSFESFSASIVVDGQPLNEYNVETSSKRGCTTVTCWIASEAGKQYKVHWKDTACTVANEGAVYVDGAYCGSKILHNGHNSRVKIVQGIKTSPTSLRPFEFSHLNMTDNEDAGLEMPINVGQIELRFRRWQRVCATGKGPSGGISGGLSLPAERTFNEKAKKGIDHQTKFGEAVGIPISKTTCGRATGEAFLQFHFRYRPLAVLQAHGIAPPPQTTSSSSHSSRAKKRPREDSTGDVKLAVRDIVEIESDDDDPEKEMERLQARMNELKAKHGDRVDCKKVKREPDERTVKREGGSSIGPLFIDLT